MIDSNEPNGRRINETGDTVRMERSICRRGDEDLWSRKTGDKVVVKKKTKKETVVGKI